MAQFEVIVVNKGNLYKYKSLFDFSPDEIGTDRERRFIDRILKDIQKQRSVAYFLQLENREKGGFIAISASRIYLREGGDGIPALQVDYLFVNKKYRGHSIVEVAPGRKLKVSLYLLTLILKLAKEKWREWIGIKSLILYPDQQNPRLIQFYQRLGFHKAEVKKGNGRIEVWMLKSIKTKSGLEQG